MSGLRFDIDQQARMGDNYASLSRNAQLFVKGLVVTQPEFSFDKHKFPMIFRPCPYFQNGEPTPTVIRGAGEMKLGAWIIKLPVVSVMGSAEKTGFILFDPFAEASGEYDANKNPYMTLRRRIAKAVKEKAKFRGISCEAWEGLLKGREAVLPNFRDYHYMQALVYTDGLNLTLDAHLRPLGLHSKDKTLALVRLSGSAFSALREQVLRLAESDIDILANPGWYVGMYKEDILGPVDADFELYQKSVQQNQSLMNLTDPQSGFGSNAALMNMMAQAGRQNGEPSGDEDFVKYGITVCRVGRMREVRSGIDAPAVPQDYRSLLMVEGHTHTWWDEIKNRHLGWGSVFSPTSDDEQVLMIARALSDKPELLEYGWGDTPFLTEEVRQILSRARHVAVSASLLGDDVVPPTVGTAAIREFVSSTPVAQTPTPQQLLAQQQAAALAQQQAAQLAQQQAAQLAQQQAAALAQQQVAQLAQQRDEFLASQHAQMPVPGTTQAPVIRNVF